MDRLIYLDKCGDNKQHRKKWIKRRSSVFYKKISRIHPSVYSFAARIGCDYKTTRCTQTHWVQTPKWNCYTAKAVPNQTFRLQKATARTTKIKEIILSQQQDWTCITILQLHRQLHGKMDVKWHIWMWMRIMVIQNWKNWKLQSDRLFCNFYDVC